MTTEPTISREEPMFDGAALVRLRLRAGLTQRQLAKASGVSHGTIARLELYGHQPRVALVALLARALGVRMERLVRG